MEKGVEPNIRGLVIVNTLLRSKKPVPGWQIAAKLREAGVGPTRIDSTRAVIVEVSRTLEKHGAGRIVRRSKMTTRRSYSLVSLDGARLGHQG